MIGLLTCKYRLCNTWRMISSAQKARAIRAAESCKRLGITQQQIADALGVSQGQVSRILGAKGIRASRLFEEVCLYVEGFDHGVTVDAVKANDELIEAVRDAWDGSAQHAKGLAAVIRTLSVLRPRQGK